MDFFTSKPIIMNWMTLKVKKKPLEISFQYSDSCKFEILFFLCFMMYKKKYT